MKRTLSLLFSVLLLATAVTACGEAEAPAVSAPDTEKSVPAAETTLETEESVDTYIESLGEKDFGGADFTVMVLRQTPEILHPATEKLTGEPINDALFQRDRDLEDKYNVRIQYPECDPTNKTGTMIATAVLAGDYVCDIYIDALCEGTSNMGAVFQKQALYNLLDVPYLQLNQKWWSSLMYDSMQFNGRMYFTSGDLTCYSFGAPACTFMNLQVASNNDIDENTVYQLVYDGKWTIDEMMLRTAGLRRDLDGDGKIQATTDAYGVVNATVTLTSDEILIGAGVKMSETDENGDLTVALDNERVFGTIEKVRQCFCETDPKDNVETLLYDCFMTDRTLFCVHFVGTAISQYRSMESDYSILPMPKYDEAQESYMSYISPYSHAYVAMPLTIKDPEMTGFITEVMEYLSVKDIRPTIYDITLKGKATRNPDSQAMLDIIFDSTYTDINAIMNFGKSADKLCDAVFSGKDFASAYAKIQSSIAKSTEKVMQKFTDPES